MAIQKIAINRAPVLTLWASIVAARSGFDEDAALSLGQALAALNAQSKGRRLGIYEAPKDGAQGRKKQPTAAGITVRLLGRDIPVIRSPHGLRAAPGGKPVHPAAVKTYLQKKFGDHLPAARLAMQTLARSLTPAQLETRGFSLYEKFRPQIPQGKRGWGAKGDLDLDLIRRMGN